MKQLEGNQKLEALQITDNLLTDFMHIVPSVIIHAAEPSEQEVGTPTFWVLGRSVDPTPARGK